MEKTQDVEKLFIERIVSSPMECYSDFHQRFKDYGQMAPFPEFKEVVNFLIDELSSDFCKDTIIRHPVLRYELNEVMTFLTHVNLVFDVEDTETYPYEIPFVEPYPYRPTLDAIEAALRLLDKINRLDEKGKAVKLYHFDRYCYHRHALISSNEVILIPTTKELTMVDFIKTRAIPIEFIGVVSRTTRVDGHNQSPLDFWYHDFNHARRLYAYIKKQLKAKNIISEEEVLRYYTHVNEFIVTVILKSFVEITPEMEEEEKAMRLLSTMIIFEIIHETALTLERDPLIADLLRPSGPQPFEYMKDEDVEDVEQLRTPTGNLQSGSSFRYDRAHETLNVRYFLDKASIGLLANVYNKLSHFYYDDAGEVKDDIVPQEFRTPEFIVKTVKNILEVLKYNATPSDEHLMDLVLNREGTKERFFIKGINDEEDSQFATEPMKADEVILMVSELDKKVFTLFGYSALEYEDKEYVATAIKKELESLDKDEYVVNIGATEEGIGFAYEIAKSLGFKTIGIVSTQALSYSGKFSSFVDNIYIINDDHWGGFLPGTEKLAETTKAYLGVSSIISAYGGGENTAVTIKEALKLGIEVRFTEADMNHKKADTKFKGKEVDYRGAAYHAWQGRS